MERNRCSDKQYTIKLKEPIFIVFALCIIVYVINAYVVRLAFVTGESMYPTLADGDLILVNQLRDEPSIGEIVLIDTSENPWLGKYIVKRVIAVEGDTVILDYECDSVYVNGVRVSEPYLYHDWGDPMVAQNGVSVVAYQVPTGAFFVMGDNRNNSIDSRNEMIGMIEKTEIVGLVFLHISFLQFFSSL